MPITFDRVESISLKNPVMIFTPKKYALEIEIFTLSRGFRPQILSGARKYCVFSSQYMGSLEGLTFSTESVECGLRD